ncbi:hypothetical protein Lal_00036743, partial [Lupinus albus]
VKNDILKKFINKTFGIHGRLCLTKVVITSLPIYTMQSIWLPKSICNEIDRVSKNFLWVVMLTNKGTWEVLTKHKRDGNHEIRDSQRQISLLGKLN